MRYDLFVSVIVPLRDDADILDAVLGDIREAVETRYRTYELIFVDDCSSDETASVFEGILDDVACVRYFRLPRQFGLEVAIECGLEQAIGDVAVVLRPECDPPHLIHEFVDEAQSNRGVAVGTRNLFVRRSVFYRVLYKTYYLMCRLLLDRPHRFQSTHYMAFTRTALNALLRIKDSSRYLRVLSMYAGYRVSTIHYERVERRPRERRRPFLPLLESSVSMIVSNSVRPLHLAAALAAAGSFANFLYIGYVVLVRYLLQGVVPGWASLSFQFAFMFGIFFLVMTVIAEYLARLLQEVKERPLYFVEHESQSRVMVTDQHVRNVVFDERGADPSA